WSNSISASSKNGMLCRGSTGSIAAADLTRSPHVEILDRPELTAAAFVEPRVCAARRGSIFESGCGPNRPAARAFLFRRSDGPVDRQYRDRRADPVSDRCARPTHGHGNHAPAGTTDRMAHPSGASLRLYPRRRTHGRLRG